MNRIWILAGTMIAAVAVAATAQTPPAASEDNDTQEKVVCKSITEIGSRLNRRRVCRTRAQWTEIESQTRQVVERVQSTKTTTGN